METKENVMKKSDVVISGLALFAMFFGAGNLIFPPYLGMQGGESWGIGYLCFIFVEVILSCAGIYAMIYAGGSISAMENSVGKIPGIILNTAAIACTGVFIAPPRTAATTYEMAVAPFTDKIGLFPFSVAFFAVVFVLTIRPTSIVDTIGKFLTPILILGIVLLIFVGIANPIGEVGPAVSEHIAQDGLEAGYQAMDIISVAGFAIVVKNNGIKIGCKTQKSLLKATAFSSCIAGMLLALIYGGLVYLGATTSSSFGPSLDQAELIVAITSNLLGKYGVIVLGIVVGFACLTTAIGLFGSSASYFESITGGKISYKTAIIILNLIGLSICNLGLSTIISAATPVLLIISPPFMTTVVLLLFHEKIENKNIYKGAALFATISSLLMTFYSYTGMFGFIKLLPFYNTGFGWLIPAALGGLIGGFLEA